MPRWGVMSVTYFELSARNAKRQARDYLVYFATVVLAAALLCAFNGLLLSGEVQTLSKSMNMMPLMLGMASAVVVCVFGWLVSYATGFMLSRRSRELGTYLLIGLENKQVARLFFLENLAVGGCALALGLVLGDVLYQALRAILLALFGIPYQFTLALSLPAVALTAVYFALIYLFALGRSRRRIRKMNIHGLIYFEKQNQGAVIRSGKGRRWVFAASVVLAAAGTVLLMSGSGKLGLTGAGCVIVGLYGFFISFASGVPAFFDRRPARKYRGVNLLVFRTLTAKLATMGVLMATISMIFTATLMAEGTGLVLRGLFIGRMTEKACFDLYIGMGEPERDRSIYLDYIEAHIPVEEDVFYQVYNSPDDQFMAYLKETNNYYSFYEQDPILRWSDYAALRSIAGYPPVELGEDQYLVHCISALEKDARGYTRPISPGGVTLELGGVHTEHLLQSGVTGQGHGYILVVPDRAAEGLSVHHLAYAAKTAEPVPYEDFYNLTVLMDQVWENTGRADQINTEASEKDELASQTALTVFPLFYLALALTMTAAAILTIQQLSESERYRRQFALLQKLGMDRRDMARALGRQFFLYYALPAVPPVLIGVPFILNLAKVPEPGVMVGLRSPAAITAFSLALFFLVYGLYILMAYTSLRRNVLPQDR